LGSVQEPVRRHIHSTGGNKSTNETSRRRLYNEAMTVTYKVAACMTVAGLGSCSCRVRFDVGHNPGRELGRCYLMSEARLVIVAGYEIMNLMISLKR
jgi:hypothetical protein